MPARMPEDDHLPLRLRGDGSETAIAQVNPGITNPLSDAHFDQLTRLAILARPIERAARYASFSGWSTLLAGAFSMPFALRNPPMLLFCIMVAAIGTRELSLHRRLLSLETRAPRLMAINQLCLGGTLIAYAVYMLASAPGEGVVASAMASDPMLQSTPELGGMLDDLTRLERLATAMLYVGMIVVAMVVQGGTALYYGLKGGRLRKLHKLTPCWAVRVYQTLR